MFNKIKETANIALKVGSKLYNESSKFVVEKTNDAVNKYQAYQEREREIISPITVKKINDKIIKESYKTTLTVELIPTKSMLFESKLGGFPYLPREMEIPKDDDGNDMRLLVQINCEDLKNIEDFPKKGLIQIYIKRDKDYGLNDYKVLYHKDINYNIKTEEIYKKTLINELEYFPIRKESNLYFTTNNDYIDFKDIKYYELFVNLLKQENNYINFTQSDIIKFLPNRSINRNIKVGGNPIFSSLNTIKTKEIVLFQLVRYNNLVEITDNKTLLFTINKNDLKNLNFENVDYIIN